MAYKPDPNLIPQRKRNAMGMPVNGKTPPKAKATSKAKIPNA